MPSGTFVLADIGGYTSFLTDVGIQHAKEITGHLLNGMFEVDSETWKLGDVEGDCLFVYRDSEASAEEVFAYLRRLYETFLESLEEVVSGSTCQCGACDRSGGLTLKFVVHAGDFDVERIAGQQQLIGPDVVVAHRLLKNSVRVREYALVTAPLAEVADASGLASTPGRDDYDDIGAIDYVSVDFQAVREAFHASREIFLTEADADVVASVEIAAPPEAVWEVIKNDEIAPRIFPTLTGLQTLSGELDEAGSVHTCLHGPDVRMIHYRVAWDEAGRRFTDRVSNVPAIGRLVQTFEVKPSGSGTRFTFYYALAPENPIEGEMRAGLVRFMQEHAEGDVAGLKAYCEAEFRGAET